LWDEPNCRLLYVIQNDRHLCRLEVEFLGKMKYLDIESESINFGSREDCFRCFRGEPFQTALCVEVGASKNQSGELIEHAATPFAKRWGGRDLTAAWVTATA
jgi:hypothetical protein